MSAVHGIITLLKLPGVGRKTVFRVLEAGEREDCNYSELRNILEELKSNRLRVRIPSRDDFDKALLEADEVEAAADAMGLKIAAWGTPEYPHRLRTIQDPPVLLFVKGSPAPLNSASVVAIVGTRKPTSYGLSAAEKTGFLCAERGFAVVSGLAAGCDAAAHKGCIAARGSTVAVLAHGLDMIYPKENESLAENIVENGGCLLSEYLPGQKPLKNYFIERDRLQSGLSDGVIIVETGIKGGTMHTVGYARDQGKKIGCISHPADYERNAEIQGNRHLIETNAAKALKNRSDVELFLKDLLMQDAGHAPKESQPPIKTGEGSGTQPSLFDIKG